MPDDARWVAVIPEWLRQDFDLTVHDLLPVHHGADALALLWRATGPDGRDYAVKLTRGGSIG